MVSWLAFAFAFAFAIGVLIMHTSLSDIEEYIPNASPFFAMAGNNKYCKKAKADVVAQDLMLVIEQGIMVARREDIETRLSDTQRLFSDTVYLSLIQVLESDITASDHTYNFLSTLHTANGDLSTNAKVKATNIRNEALNLQKTIQFQADSNLWLWTQLADTAQNEASARHQIKTITSLFQTYENTTRHIIALVLQMGSVAEDAHFDLNMDINKALSDIHQQGIRENLTLDQILRDLVAKDEFIPRAKTWLYNMTIPDNELISLLKTGTGNFSPSSGRRFSFVLEYNNACTAHSTIFPSMRMEVSDAIDLASMKMKRAYDRFHTPMFFGVGNWVLLRLHKGYNIPSSKKLGKKLSQQYTHPLQIVERVGRLAYKLAIPEHWRVHPIFSVVQLEPSTSPHEDPFRRHKFQHDEAVDEEQNPGYWEIEHILDKRMTGKGKKTVQYLVRYQGYEPEFSQLSNSFDMAAVINFVSDSTRFCPNTMIPSARHHGSPEDSLYRQPSRSRVESPTLPSPQTHPTSVNDGTPPSSTNTQPKHADSQDLKPSRTTSVESDRRIIRSTRSLDDVQKYGRNTIKVRDLAHIESIASEGFLSLRSQSERPRTEDDPTLKYEISGMPITDIIEMVAGLLTKITTTNDRQYETLQRCFPSAEQTANLSGLTSSVLAFHGKNVPSITILSYLTRIQKYCPTTYEVFLSLLVYFDRITKRVVLGGSRPSSSYSEEGSDLADTPPGARSVPELESELDSAQYTHASGLDFSLAQLPLSYVFVVDSFNIHRLVIAGFACVNKFFSDTCYTNSRYAKVGGLPLNELNHLELQFFLLNDFRLSISVEELEDYGTMLVEFYAREVLVQK
ncbi:hypothetical protein SBOR_6916 [Sclerotinia borealis F-4128]|uniref:Tf2-1-like SH3-like domain-containing protein n=1 Tax=Sclerotinia borealis (strain F-4128) TaxID=1432307 RepID=W9CD03_SCLBF|nr:hypothetical protein SBOR_6916 [Sclerotinia borealis F-4128]